MLVRINPANKDHNVIILVHGFTKVISPSLYASNFVKRIDEQKNLCFSARLTQGRCAVVWILLICVKVIFKLFTMGARQRYLFKKADGFQIPGAL